jgi:hypothetical protein
MLIENRKRSHRPATTCRRPGACFAYYLLCVFIAAALIGVLYLGSLLG